MLGYIYILESLKNHRFYIGSSINPQKRLLQHNSGSTTFTKNNRPYILVFCKPYPNILQARKIELWLKKSKSKKILKDIIEKQCISKIIT